MQPSVCQPVQIGPALQAEHSIFVCLCCAEHTDDILGERWVMEERLCVTDAWILEKLGQDVVRSSCAVLNKLWKLLALLGKIHIFRQNASILLNALPLNFFADWLCRNMISLGHLIVRVEEIFKPNCSMILLKLITVQLNCSLVLCPYDQRGEIATREF